MGEIVVNVWTLIVLSIAYTFLAITVVLNLVGTGQIEVSIFSNEDFSNFTMCEGKNLEDTTTCLVDYVRTFYNYQVTDDTPQSFESLKENGGDCFDYSILYKDMFESLGFKAKTVTFYGDEVGHQVTIAWNDDIDYYCLVDQMVYTCVELESIDELEGRDGQ